jgi:hypothetical protein
MLALWNSPIVGLEAPGELPGPECMAGTERRQPKLAGIFSGSLSGNAKDLN